MQIAINNYILFVFIPLMKSLAIIGGSTFFVGTSSALKLRTTIAPFVPSENPLDPGTNQGDPDYSAIAGPEETRWQIGRTTVDAVEEALADEALPGPRDLLGDHPEPFTPGPVAPIPPYPILRV